MILRRLFTLMTIAVASTAALAQDLGTTEIRRVEWYGQSPQQCNVAWGPDGLGANGSYTYYLPPDVPDPVQIEDISIDNEMDWPSDIKVAPSGSWFAAIDPGQTYLSCSHWPGNQDCPIINSGAPGSNQFSGLKVLGQLAQGKQLIHAPVTHPNYYHRGDAILIGTPCYTTSGSTAQHVNPNFTFGLTFPKYTPTTTCDTRTKLLLHGGMFPSPIDRSPLTHFVSDSSPSWHTIATIPLGGSSSNVTIDASTPAAMGQTTSISLDGTTNTGLWANASGDFALGAGDWTLDFWWRPGSTGTQFQQLWGWKGYASFLVGQQGTQLFFSATTNGTSWNVAATSWGSVTAGTWTHVVAQRSGGQITLSQDGALKQTIPVSGALYDLAHSPIYLGNSYSGAIPATGNMQEVRFSQVARFAGGSYTVPTSPYPCP
jgi:hypothetical protein